VGEKAVRCPAVAVYWNVVPPIVALWWVTAVTSLGEVSDAPPADEYVSGSRNACGAGGAGLEGEPPPPPPEQAARKKAVAARSRFRR
jgi:hypothetical protein